MRIVIVGPAASGKDVLRKRFENIGLQYGKPYTTRPKRDNETNNDYFFVDETTFNNMLECDLFAVHNTYNEWKYGITNETLAIASVFVMTPEYLQCMNEQARRSSFIIYLCPNEDVRRKRLAERNDADSVERRLEADREQFKDFNEYTIKITNPNF